MGEDPKPDSETLCPSARAEIGSSIVFGVVGGTVEEPRVGYLVEPQPVTAEVLALSSPANPGEVFRVAAPCAGGACLHFDGSNCRLAQRIVTSLPTVVDRLPACGIRPRCRWWKQEGKAACMRCPLIVSERFGSSEQLRWVANPNSATEK